MEQELQQIVDTHLQKSSLVQVGLEIPVEVLVAMYLREKNQLCLKKYEFLVSQKYQKYQDPNDGSFDDATSAIIRVSYNNSSDDEDSDVDLYYK